MQSRLHISLLLVLLSAELKRSSGFFLIPIARTQTPLRTPLLHPTCFALRASGIAEAIDPYSERAIQICFDLGLSEEQYVKATELAELICEWNESINLISRRNCSVDTVFARHILPCLCGPDIFDDRKSTSIMDIGTGGGFPGLPLAIKHPTCRFVLADSVGKKLSAVADMAERLQLTNVDIYHGRAEQYKIDTDNFQPFDCITGRSVKPIPQFCGFGKELLQKDGNMVYWTGGDIDDSILNNATMDICVRDVLDGFDEDKRILVFAADAVRSLADTSLVAIQNTSSHSRKRSQSRKSKSPKGAWQKRKGAAQRGFDNFERYDSTR